MLHLLRILAVLLALTTGGVFQTLAYAAEEHGECADEESANCTDCSPLCATCVCCPVRAAAAPHTMVVQWVAALREPVVVVTEEPVVSALVSDIFQPPRA